MANDVTAFALEALAAGGGPAAVAVAEALSTATRSGDAAEQQRALVALAAVCASPAAKDAVAGGAVEAAVDALEAAPAHALRCLADCVRSCPAAATKATRPHVLHAVLRAAQKCAADMRVAYAATTLVAAVVAEEHVACYSVPLVVEEGALLLLNDALNCARSASDYPLAIAALRAGGDIAAHAHYAEDGADRIRASMLEIGLISAATNVFAEMFSSILIRDAGLAFIANVCHESTECASHFGGLKGGDGIRLVLSASRRQFRPQVHSPLNSSSHIEDVTSRSSTDAHPSELKSSSDLSREQNSELNRKTADALAQITLVERNCGVIRSLRGVSTIVTLVANVAHSARHVEAALISFQRCIENSQFAARDAFHAGAVAAIILAMQRHRHRASVQSHSIRSLIALTELYDCHRQAACRSFAVQAVYFALTEHGRSPDIVTLACKFMLLLSPCDIISNQICVADLLRVVSMRRGSNTNCVEVQTAATNLLEAIQFIPGDLLRKVETQVVQIPGTGMRSSGALPGSVPVTSGSIIGGADLHSRRNVLNWRKRANTSSSLRMRTSGKTMPSSRLSFPVISRTEADVLSEPRDRRFTGRTRSNNGTESLSGELHRQIEDDILAGVEKGPETFLMRQTLGRTLESARRPELECDDGISLDETRLEETLSSTTAMLPDLRLNSVGSSGMSSPHSPVHMGSPGNTSAGSEPASPPWSPWTNWNGTGNGPGEQLRPFSLSDMPAGTPDCGEASSAGSLVPYGVTLGSGLPSTVRRGETGSLGQIY